jgi:hypothetical protein
LFILYQGSGIESFDEIGFILADFMLFLGDDGFVCRSGSCRFSLYLCCGNSDMVWTWFFSLVSTKKSPFIRLAALFVDSLTPACTGRFDAPPNQESQQKGEDIVIPEFNPMFIGVA